MSRRLLPVIVAILVMATAAPAPALIRPDTACRTGEAAMTFDDGPGTLHTRRLLAILRRDHAQATFFVQGRLAVRHRDIVREMVGDGHAVENHSWDHPRLTTRSDRSVRRQLTLTTHAIEDTVGVRPGLYRPPYGSTGARIRAIARAHRLQETLWTIDSGDWSGRDAAGIRTAALTGLRPHRPNVILMHDNVTNSGATVRAVPGIVRGLRARGYCLVPLEKMMPLGRLSAAPVKAFEPSDASTLVTVTFRLDGPSQRAGSFRVRSRDDTAVAGVDYRAVDRPVKIHRGDRSVKIHVRVHADPDAGDRRFTLRLDRPDQVQITTTEVDVTIVDHADWSSATAELILSAGDGALRSPHES